MEIPIMMKNKIKKFFYDKKIYIIKTTEIIEEDGNVIEGKELTNKFFFGNVNTSNNNLTQKEYGLETNSIITITTDYEIEKNSIIKFLDEFYKVFEVKKFDSHNLIIGEKCK